MKINGKNIVFESSDMPFLKKHGLEAATNMVKEHFKVTDMPFIRDTYQLAAELGLKRKELFSLLRGIDSYYTEIKIPKRSGGVRILHAPRGMLCRAQSRILRIILKNASVSRFASAYVKGKSLACNAAPHVGKKYLLKMDITDFFGSITYLQVISAAFPSGIYPTHIGAMLTKLCTRKECLPQGAPTSPVLSNIVMKNFDEALGNFCEKQGVSYTRYCDDLTFSGDIKLYHVYQKAAKMLGEMGFEVNPKKTRFITNAARQTVTGIVVNDKLSVPREYKRELRQELYYALTYGLYDAAKYRGTAKYYEDEYGFFDTEKYRATLLGKIEYVLSICGETEWLTTARDRLLYYNFK